MSGARTPRASVPVRPTAPAALLHVGVVALMLGGTLTAWRITSAPRRDDAARVGRHEPTGPAGDLLRATERGDVDAVGRLLAAGGDPNVGRPAPPALRGDDRSRRLAAKRLRDAPTPLLQIAIQNGDRGLIPLLLSRGAKVDAPGRFGYTALHHAARLGDEPTVRLLLARGAEPDAREALRAETPLLHAVRSHLYWERGARPVETARALLAAGADPNAANRDGMTPLFVAAAMRDEPLCRLLLDRGADPNARVPGNGATPLMAAATARRRLVDAHGAAKVIRLLLARGARRDARDTQGHTAADLARLFDHAEAAAALSR